MLGNPKGLPSTEEGEEDTGGCSVSAVVASAFAMGEPVGPLPRGGTRRTENLEVADIRDAREPGRSGEETTGEGMTGEGITGT